MYETIYVGGATRKITYEKEGSRLKATIKIGQREIVGYGPPQSNSKFEAYEALQRVINLEKIK